MEKKLLKKRLEDFLQEVDPAIREVLKLLPPYQPHPRLPSDWFIWQVIERYSVLKHANLVSGANVLEIGCGPQAIATIPLALLVGENGRVIALDRGRWGDFCKLMEVSGLNGRVIPIQEDARNLPFQLACFDLVVCIHGIRSFENREAVIEAVREMLRVSKERIFLAESSPIARNMAQKAHLTMYNLRRPVFLALGQEVEGDLPYFSPEEVENILKEAGAAKVDIKPIDVNMPHHLAWFPIEIIEKIRDEKIREDLKRKWKDALKMLEKYGEEHPPVIIANAWKNKQHSV